MLHTLAVPNAVLPPPVSETTLPSPVLSGGASSLPQTYQAVASGPSVQNLLNNVRGGGVVPPSSGAGASVLSASVPQSGTSGAGQLLSGFSSGFMAQLLAQGDTSLIGAYPQPSSPTPDPAMLERFSLTKYLPSRAFEPAPPPRNITQSVAQQPVPAAQPRDTNQASTVVETNQQTAVVRDSAPVEQASRPAPTTAQPTVEPRNISPEPRRTDRPALRDTGFSSYLATFSRNVEFLSPNNPFASALTA